MTTKIVILFAAFLLIQGISAQYLGYGNLQNGLSANYASNLAQNNLASNLYGTNNLANVYGGNLAANAVTNNLVSSTAFAGNNIGLGQNLASNVVSNNFAGQSLASNVATNNLLGQNLAVNSLSNAANIASTSGLLEGISASNGGVFTVTSTSPIVPTGLSVYSDNLLIEGPVTVSGQLPFLSAIAVEGSLPTSGQGVAGCGCGDGNIGIVNELNNAGLYGGLGRPGLGRY